MACHFLREREEVILTIPVKTYHATVLVIKEAIALALNNGDTERVEYLQNLADKIAAGDPAYTPYKPRVESTRKE